MVERAVSKVSLYLKNKNQQLYWVNTYLSNVYYCIV